MSGLTPAATKVDQRPDEFAGVLNFGQADFVLKFFNLKLWKQPLQVRDERRRIQRPAIRVVAENVPGVKQVHDHLQ